MTKLLVLVCLLFSFNSFGAEYLKKGEPAPHNGVLFTDTEEEKLRANNEKLKSLEQLTIVYERKDKLNEERIKNYKEYIQDTKQLNTYGKIGYFFLGFLASSATLYVSSKIVKNVK